MANCFRDMTWFIRVELSGFAFANRAKPAVTRADVAAQHESSGAIRPAFKDVRALRFLTNRVQVQPLDQLEQVVLIRWVTQPNAQPLRLWLTRFLVENVKFAGQSIYLFI
jgi:hypothetical protein